MTDGALVAGRYAIEGKARTGGMATVFRAVDRQSGHPVAVKLLDLLDPGSTARFAREAAALARLRHPGIVTYIDHGRHRGRSYLVMEWLEGQSLADAMDTGLTPADTVRIGAAAAAALAHAHERGLVHRDVKPDNLVLADDGGVKVVDFGIAHWAGGRVRFTETGSVIGTPGYMSPEQARGRHPIDGRADVFSLGCVLYECLCGCPAFAGENTPATLVKIALADPVPIRERAPDLPAELAQFIEGMLAKEPGHRPEAAVVSAELTRLAPGAGGLAVVSRWESQATEVSAAPRCVLLAVPPPGASEEASEAAPEAVALAAARGATVERMIDGALVIAVGEPRAAAGQVRAAVELALDLTDRLPGFILALAVGRGRGEAVDEAGRVLVDALLASATGERAPSGAVHVAAGAAGFLGDAFAVEMRGPHALVRRRLS